MVRFLKNQMKGFEKPFSKMDRKITRKNLFWAYEKLLQRTANFFLFSVKMKRFVYFSESWIDRTVNEQINYFLAEVSWPEDDLCEGARSLGGPRQICWNTQLQDASQGGSCAQHTAQHTVHIFPSASQPWSLCCWEKREMYVRYLWIFSKHVNKRFLKKKKNWVYSFYFYLIIDH